MSIFDVGFRLYTADSSDGRPIYPESATFGYDALMNGQATVTFHAGDDALDLLGVSLGSEFAEVAFRAMDSGGTSIWGGPAIVTNLSSSGRGRVSVTFRHFWQHIHERRAVLAASYAASDTTLAAENLALTVQRAQISTPVVPSGHPGTRSDFGSFTPTVAANHGSPASPSRRHIIQSGNNLLSAMNELYENADLAPKLTDALTGALTIDNEYPFEDNDLTEDVIFGQYHGNLASFELTSDRTGLANIWFVEGKTANSPQVASDAASITAWGEFEAYAQKPEDSNVNTFLGQTATDLRDGYAETRITYKAELIQTDGHRFVEDFFWRDKIRIEDAIFGVYVEQTIKAWQMQVDRGRLTRTDIVLGVPRAPDLMRHVAGYTGVPGAHIGGSPWRNRRQA